MAGLSTNMNEFFQPDNWFRQKYEDKPGGRYYTFKVALNLFLQRRGETIVETGCIREKDDWGAGASTFIFGEVLSRYGNRLYTIDNNKEHLERAEKLTKQFSGNISYILGDSIVVLEDFDKRIDFLYLDSLDYPLREIVKDDAEFKRQVQAAQEHNLKEVQAAWTKLHRDTIILLDDCEFEEGGKPKLTIEFLQSRGWKVLLEGKQVLMIT